MKLLNHHLISMRRFLQAHGAMLAAVMLVVSGLAFEQTIYQQTPRQPEKLESTSSDPAIMPPETGASVSQPQSRLSQSLVNIANETSRQQFVAANGLTPDQLKPIPGQPTTFIVEKPAADLISAGSTVYPRIEYRALYSFTNQDPIYPQWYTDKISAPAAWDITTGSPSVSVAVIDSGFGLAHEDMANRWAVNTGESGSTIVEGLAPNCTSRALDINKNCNNLDDDLNGKTDDWRGWDFVLDDNDPSAGTQNPAGGAVSHGTSTAGLVGATGNNGKGVASINWGAQILPLQVLDDDGSGYTDDVAAAVDYAVSRGVKVINLSLGAGSTDTVLQQSINNAIAAGVTIVAAAGNCGDPATYFFNGCNSLGQVLYPANYPSVLAVGATDSNDNRASFSSYGANVDVVAPGTGTIRTPMWQAGNQTSAYSGSANGTSFASPIAAGLVALVRGQYPSANRADIERYIVENADKVAEMRGQNSTNEYGYGRINALRPFNITTSAYVGQSGYPKVVSGGAAVPAHFLYKNTGNIAWYDDTSVGSAPAGTKPVHLATNRPLNRVSIFSDNWVNGNRPALNFAAVYDADGSTLAANQNVAQPGQVIKFSFNFKVPAGFSPGTYREYFQPIVEGGAIMNEPWTFLDVRVETPIYTSAYAGQSGYPTLTAGGPAVPAYFLYKNTGNTTWYDDTSIGSAPSGTKPVHLATNRPINRISNLSDRWINGNRPVFDFAAIYESDGITLASNQHVAQPGQITKFSFNFRAPAGLARGTYREYFQPIVEGGAIMNEPWTFLDVTVQ